MSINATDTLSMITYLLNQEYALPRQQDSPHRSQSPETNELQTYPNQNCHDVTSREYEITWGDVT